MAKRCGFCRFRSDDPDEFTWHVHEAHGFVTKGANPPTPKTGARTLVRVYRGSQQNANGAFASDAGALAKQGYVPVTQIWTPGEWGGGTFMVALVLCIFLVGILIFFYLLIVKPEGTLTVTYELREEPVVEETRACPRCAETIKAAAKVCRFCSTEL